MSGDGGLIFQSLLKYCIICKCHLVWLWKVVVFVKDEEKTVSWLWILTLVFRIVKSSVCILHNYTTNYNMHLTIRKDVEKENQGIFTVRKCGDKHK